MLNLVVRVDRVQHVGRELTANALESPGSQMQKLDVHLQPLDRFLVEAARPTIHREHILVCG